MPNLSIVITFAVGLLIGGATTLALVARHLNELAITHREIDRINQEKEALLAEIIAQQQALTGKQHNCILKFTEAIQMAKENTRKEELQPVYPASRYTSLASLANTFRCTCGFAGANPQAHYDREINQYWTATRSALHAKSCPAYISGDIPPVNDH